MNWILNWIGFSSYDFLAQIALLKDLKTANNELQMSIPAPIYTEEQNVTTDESGFWKMK